MAVWVVEFSNGGKKIRNIFAYERKALNFENWVNRKVSKSAKILLSKSIFYVKNCLNLSPFFFFIKEY